jgi:hypothetical protein
MPGSHWGDTESAVLPGDRLPASGGKVSPGRGGIANPALGASRNPLRCKVLKCGPATRARL